MCFADEAGNVGLTSNLRLYSNTDVMDGFVCIRHDGRQHNIRVSRRLRPAMDELRVGPLRLEIVEPMRACGWCSRTATFGIALDVTCRGPTVPYEDPGEVTRVDGRLVSERMTYELTGKCAGWVQVGGDRHELDPATSSFFRNHSWGVPGRSRRAEAVRRADASVPAAGCPGCGSGCSSTCPITAGSTSSIRAAGRRQARVR